MNPDDILEFHWIQMLQVSLVFS